MLIVKCRFLLCCSLILAVFLFVDIGPLKGILVNLVGKVVKFLGRQEVGNFVDIWR